MKKIEAVIQPFKLDEVREILAKAKIPRVNIFEVKGAGSQQGRPKEYRGARYIEDSAEVKIEMVVDDDEAELVADMIINALRTGDLCDGEVIIVPVEHSVRLRAGRRDHGVPSRAGDPVSSSLIRDGARLKSYFRSLRRKFHEPA